MRLNLGCGRNPLPGYVNLDRQDLPGVDVIHDLERLPLPFLADTFDEVIGIDLIEHITDALGLMGELWRIAKPDATCTFALPYGSSDDAWEDPTHVRPYFINSWSYFSQPYYYRAQYNTTDEYDMFGRRVHPSTQCPWHVPNAWEAVQEVRNDRPTAAGKESLPVRGMREAVRREGVVSRSLATDAGEGMGRSGSFEATERSGQVLEGSIPLPYRPRWEDASSGTQMGDGTTSRAIASSLGERPSRQWGSVEQFARELGTVVQATADWTESERLAELGRFVLSEGSGRTPELGQDGCTCTVADYGFRGDWQPETIQLDVTCEGDTVEEILVEVMALRNVVQRQIVTLRAVKPAREPLQSLIVSPQVAFNRVGG